MSYHIEGLGCRHMRQVLVSDVSIEPVGHGENMVFLRRRMPCASPGCCDGSEGEKLVDGNGRTWWREALQDGYVWRLDRSKQAQEATP